MDTKQSLEREAEELEQREFELAETSDYDDSYLTYLRLQAQHLRGMAVNAPDEDEYDPEPDLFWDADTAMIP